MTPQKPDCETCQGQGEIYTHTVDCRSDWCALAGGMDDCLGQVIECPSCQHDELIPSQEQP